MKDQVRRDAIIVYPSRWKLGGMALAFIGIGGGMAALFVDGYQDGKINFTWMIGILVLIGVVCGSGVVRVLSRLLRRTPAVIVDERGIFDNSKLMGSFGWVGWEEIDCIYRGQFGSMEHLYIGLKNGQGFLKRQPPLRRVNMLGLRIQRQGSYAAILGMMLPISLEDLERQIKEYMTGNMSE